MWLETEEEIAVNQSYTIKDKSFTRADLGQVRKEIDYWSAKVAALENLKTRKGRKKFMRPTIEIIQAR